MNKNNIYAIVLIFILISVIRAIGIENIPFWIIATILILCSVGAFLIALKYKGSKKEKNYLLVMTILVTLLFSVFITAVTIENNYPQISKQYKSIFIALMGVLFLCFLLVVFANAIYKTKNKR